MPPWTPPTILSQTGLSLFPKATSLLGLVSGTLHCPHSRQSPVQWHHLSRLLSHFPVWIGRWSPNWFLCSCYEPLQPLSHSSSACCPQYRPPASSWKPSLQMPFHHAQAEARSSYLGLYSRRPQAWCMVSSTQLGPLPSVNLALPPPGCVALPMSCKPFVLQFPHLCNACLIGWS